MVKIISTGKLGTNLKVAIGCLVELFKGRPDLQRVDRCQFEKIS